MSTTALVDVLVERGRQDAKWGEQNHHPIDYLAILVEEVGELAQAALKARFEGDDSDRIREEAVQVAAVALAIVECLDRRKWQWPQRTGAEHRAERLFGSSAGSSADSGASPVEG